MRSVGPGQVIDRVVESGLAAKLGGKALSLLLAYLHKCSSVTGIPLDQHGKVVDRKTLVRLAGITSRSSDVHAHRELKDAGVLEVAEEGSGSRAIQYRLVVKSSDPQAKLASAQPIGRETPVALNPLGASAQQVGRSSRLRPADWAQAPNGLSALINKEHSANSASLMHACGEGEEMLKRMPRATAALVARGVDPPSHAELLATLAAAGHELDAAAAWDQLDAAAAVAVGSVKIGRGEKRNRPGIVVASLRREAGRYMGFAFKSRKPSDELTTMPAAREGSEASQRPDPLIASDKPQSKIRDRLREEHPHQQSHKARPRTLRDALREGERRRGGDHAA